MGKCKQILSVLLAVLMIVTAVPFAFAEENTNIPEGYTPIYTVDDLYFVRNDLTANYILMNDIDLSEATAEGGDWDYDGRGWNPIGSEDRYSNSAFSGVFDGNGCSITGLRINIKNYPSGTSGSWVGLFSNVSGTVKNLSVYGNIFINYNYTTSYAGGIAAYVSGNGKIENCRNYVTMNVFVSNAGGIAGCNYGTITQCANYADLIFSGFKLSNGASTTSYFGGIVGMNDASSSRQGAVTQCVNKGTLNLRGGNTVYLNGITYNDYYYSSDRYYYARVSDCYNVADVNVLSAPSTLYCAGIVWQNNNGGGTVTNCYNRGIVNDGAGYAVSNYSAVKCYYLKSTGTNSTGATALNENQMKLQGMYSGWDFDTIWKIDSDAEYIYPTLIGVPDISSSQDPEPEFDESWMWSDDFESATLTLTDRTDGTEVALLPAEISISSVPVTCGTDGVKTYTATAEYNGTSYRDKKEIITPATGNHTPGEEVETVISAASALEEGLSKYTVYCTVCGKVISEREAASPCTYEGYTKIYTKQDLDNIRLDMGKKYVLMNDIEFTDEDYIAGGEFYNSGKGWSPIGTSSVPFTGSFNGQNYTISGIHINDPGADYAGLFGYMNSGTKVENLCMTDVDLTANNALGSIAGYSAGSISNCSATGILHTIGNNCGGICGYAKNARIEECWFDGTAKADGNNAGGITGTSAYGTVEKCQTYGLVDAGLNAGGITGFLDTASSGSAVYSMCANFASIYGKNAGGIIGKNSLGYYTWTYPLTTSPNTGYGRDFSSAYSTIENCFNSGSIEGKVNAAGILGYQVYPTDSYSGNSSIKSITSINSCYNVGSIVLADLPDGDDTIQEIGGIVCSAGKKLSCSPYCYYLDQMIVNVGENSYGTEKSNDQMVKQSTYTNWNFDTVWSINSEDPYPYPVLAQLDIPAPFQICAHTDTVLQNVKEATCGEDGYTGDLVCIDCGEVLQYGTVISATGIHTPGAAVFLNEVAASCTEAGSYDSVTYCTICGEEVSRETITLDALGHDEKVYSKEATCSETGYLITICQRCGETLSSEMIPLKDHTWDNGVKSQDSTCTSQGMITYTCTVCGATRTEPTDLLAHDWDDGVVTKEPSCTEAGEMTYTCSVGGETRTEPIDKLDHALVLVPGYAATCTEEGLTDGWKCENCGKWFAEQKTIDKIAHTPGEAVRENEVPATCGEAGSYDSVTYCTICGEELSRETKTIDKLAHIPGESVRENEVAATCKAEGSFDEVIRCTECGEELSRETKTLYKLAHMPGEAVRENIVEATYDVGGSYDEVIYCTVCHDELSRKTVATDPLTHTHTYVAETIKEATCSVDGEEVYTCSICGDSYKKPIPATGDHVDEGNDGYCDTCGQQMTGGDHCKYCGKIHDGAFGWLVKFFHSILAIFKR